MPKRIANNKIILVRDGQRVVIKPNQSFDFTTAEIKDIEAGSSDTLRKLVNEAEEVVEVKVPAPAATTKPTKAEAKAAAAAAEAGNGDSKTGADDL